MPYSPLEGFKIGQEVGKAKRSTFGMTSDSIFDQFNKGMEQDRELSKSIGVLGAKEMMERNRPPTKLEQSQIDLNEQKTKDAQNPRTRQVISYNPATQEMEVVGQFSKGDIVRNSRIPTGEQLQSAFSAQNLKASSDFLLEKLNKDPDLLLKASVPGKFGMDSMDRSIYEGMFKEMAAITGGKTLTESEKAIAKSTMPQAMDILRSGSKNARIGSRASMKVLSELYKRHNARITSGDINAVPEFTKDDLLRIQNEAANEYSSLFEGGNPLQQASTPRADIAQDASGTSNQGGDLEARKQKLRDRYLKGA